MKLSNKKFSFTDSNINKIKILNNKLKKEEIRILPFAIQLKASLVKLVNEGVIYDSNFFSSLSLYSNNAKCNKRNNSSEGNPFWVEKHFSLFHQSMDKDDMFYTDNWNELPKEHPLGNEFFCYSMHCICFHSHLSWQDFVDIDDVWIDLKVDYQFKIEMDC